MQLTEIVESFGAGFCLEDLRQPAHTQREGEGKRERGRGRGRGRGEGEREREREKEREKERERERERTRMASPNTLPPTLTAALPHGSCPHRPNSQSESVPHSSLLRRCLSSYPELSYTTFQPLSTLPWPP